MTVAIAMAWLTTDRAFSVDPSHVILTGLRYTDPAEVRRSMRLVGDVRPATVVISTRSMEAAIRQLPTVADVQVRATLPDALTVTVTERAPIVAWSTADDGWLMDVEGVMFASTDREDAATLGDGATGSALPAVSDRRPDGGLRLGAQLDPVDLEAVRLLGAITPEMIRSKASELFLSLDDKNGWVLTAPGHWRAIFGQYTGTLLPATRIPDQVACLRSVLGDRESTIDVVTLAVSGTPQDACGTFVEGTPEPTRRPRRTPRPTRTTRP